MYRELTIKKFPDADLNGCYFESDKTPVKGAVLLGCAMGITQKYYKNLAKFLMDAGFNVLTFDFRGTGISSPKKLKGYEVDLFDWVNDVSASIEFLKSANPGPDLIYVGHSITGQLLGFAQSNYLADRAVFLASCTGYWKDSSSLHKWKNLFLLSIAMPLLNFIWGYTNARLIGLGENYPKKVSLQWRKWCLHPQYLGVEGRHSSFENYTKPITSIYFTDDPIANRKTVSKLLAFYTRAKTETIEISPKDFSKKKIGHAGFLSRRWKKTLWKKFLEEIEGTN